MKKNRSDAYSDKTTTKSRSKHSRLKKNPDRPFLQTQKSKEKKERPQGFYLYGLHPVIAAISNPQRKILSLHVTENSLTRVKDGLPKERFEAISQDIVMAERDAIEMITGPDALHQGVVLKTEPLSDLSLDIFLRNLEGQDHVLMILDQITDPHNIGAILRSCAIFGASALIVTERNAAPESAIMAKTSSGALETIPIVRVGNLKQAMGHLGEAGFWITGFAGEAQQELGDIDLTGRCALVMGSEGKGMRRLVRDYCDHLAQIPMEDNNVGSLNVSNAAAIGLYEANRQRRLKKMT